PNDCSVGDVDGDGQYEIFLKWDPSNAKDNSQEGKTDNVYIDCYTLTGKRLWRINMGQNIRAGQHYTQMCVADFDCDGKAELITKTADGTKDGTGKVIGDGSKSYANGKGYILDGAEYLSLFDGQTGACLDTIDYPVPRGKVSDWGDNYGNRVDRMNSGIAYLDGVHPSAIYGRGYYTRLTWSAVDVRGGKLVKRWVYDSGNKGGAFGNGNHNVMAADVDNDGKQEIITGSACIDDDGKLLWVSGDKHGDAMHVGDLIPDHEGIEIWECHEDNPYGETCYDGATGKKLFHINGSNDTGRCAADNVWAGNAGAEFWGAADNNVYDKSGKKIAGSKPAQNFFIYWDGDLEREILDGTKIAKMTGAGTYKNIFTAGDCAANNSSKNVPCLTADLFGDWREELILRTSDNSKLRIWCTTDTTKVRLTTLMHDMQYRAQNACEQSCYNQPPHVSYYLASDAPLPARPNVLLNNSAPASAATDPVIVPETDPEPYTEPEPAVISGKYVRNLTILDTAHAAGWKLGEAGGVIFGDRAYTYTEFPAQLAGAEAVLTACDSKKTDSTLASFSAGENIDVYVLLDTRVEENNAVPAWLSGWQKTAMTASSSNDVTFSVYQKRFTANETVNLGTNGMDGNVVNYTAAVTAAQEQAQALRGDVNSDGKVDRADVTALLQYLLTTGTLTAEQAAQADMNGDNCLSAVDLSMLKRLLLL
ncbi:MAG: cellulose 1,4-beta-cellobiosidase, partial [Oscillospiraceae bacterium]|nr:cellulose 1,4-beta-cellobiosidase [Oscillospiraceae bacterium]